MKVLLISTNRLTSPYPVYPLGLDYVAGALEPDHQVRVLDLCGCADNDPLVEAVAELEPDVVGVSLRNIDNTDAVASIGFVDELRDVVATVRRVTRAPVVLGGAGFTLFPEELLEAVGADYGIVGEGERLAALLDALRAGGPVDGLAGLIARGAAPQPPSPYDGQCRRRLPEQPERLSRYLRRGGMLNLQTKRGCPFCCFYCTYPLLEGRRLRLFPPEQVGAEARALQAAGARFLFVADSVFNSDHHHAVQVARAMRQAGVSIPWGAFFAPLAPPPGFYRELADCGCSHVEFGTDTLDERMLSTYRKAFTVEDVFAAHCAAGEAGLHVAHYFMLGGPGECEKTVTETLYRANELERSVCFFFCGIRIYPGTELWRHALAEGRLSPRADLLEPVFYQPAAISLGEVGAIVEQRGGGRVDWVIGSGGEQTARILERMYARGRAGPLWEWLIR